MKPSRWLYHAYMARWRLDRLLCWALWPLAAGLCEDRHRPTSYPTMSCCLDTCESRGQQLVCAGWPADGCDRWICPDDAPACEECGRRWCYGCDHREPGPIPCVCRDCVATEYQPCPACGQHEHRDRFRGDTCETCAMDARGA